MTLTFSDFFYNYGMYIAIAVAVLLIILVIVLLVRNKAKNNKRNDDAIYSKIIEGLGGFDNIITMEAKMSRLNVELKDDNLLNMDSLKENGVSRVIKMSNKITLLLGELAVTIANKFDEKK